MATQYPPREPAESPKGEPQHSDSSPPAEPSTCWPRKLSEAASGTFDALALQTGAAAGGDWAEHAGIGCDRSSTLSLPAFSNLLPPFRAGEVIADKYRIIEPLGEGGMGTVYRAEQLFPVQRPVALKAMQPGGNAAELTARFAVERQLLAQMDHPNIAKVFDAGVTPGHGAPYFVMELVPGVPLTVHCERHKLSVRQRIELFIQVCHAVQHAHQKGIIHRDLKPSNILVAEYEGRPTPKVIDFGVAKVHGAVPPGQTLATRAGTLVGTPEYMSPEQANPEGQDIDTRSDIYALGVVLYQLLTGSLPFDRFSKANGNVMELLRIIRDDDPERPSVRVAGHAFAAAFAAGLGLSSAGLAKELRGDLDWVVMKALEKDRERRYDSANDLARDLQRYLANEPVEARPPSVAYRLRKLYRRNRLGTLAAGAAVAAVLLAIAGTTWGMLEARRAAAVEHGLRLEEERLRMLAQRERDAKEVARREEERQRRFAQAISSFVSQDLLALTSAEGQLRFGGANEAPLHPNLTLGQLLERAARKLDERRDLEPRIEAELRWMVGVNLRALGLVNQALPHLRRSAELREQLFGPAATLTFQAKNSLGVALGLAGRHDEAIQLLGQTRDLQSNTFGPLHPDTLTTANNLAAALASVHRIPEALKLQQQVFEARKKVLGEDSLDAIQSEVNFAELLLLAGQAERGQAVCERGLERIRSVLGPGHLLTLSMQQTLGRIHRERGDFGRAADVLEECLRLCRAHLEPDHILTMAALNNLASTRWSQQRLEESIPLFEEACKGRERTLGRNHPHTLLTIVNLAVNYQGAGRHAEALPLLEEAYRGLKGNPSVPWLGMHLLHSLAEAGEKARSVALAKELEGQFRSTRPIVEKTLAEQLADIGARLVKVEVYAEAEQLLKESHRLWKKQAGDLRLHQAELRWAAALLGLNKPKEAEPLLRRGLAGLKEGPASQDMQARLLLQSAARLLARVYHRLEQPEEAAKWKKLAEAPL